MGTKLRLCLLGIFFGMCVIPEVSFAQSSAVQGSPEDVADVPESAAVVPDGCLLEVSEDAGAAGPEDVPDAVPVFRAGGYAPDGRMIEDVSDASLMLSSEMLPVDAVPAEGAGSPDDGGPDEMVMSEDASEMRLPNPSYEIEHIRITGNRQTSREYILKMLALDTSRPVTLESLEAARIRLVASGLFQSVDMSLSPGSGRGKLGISLELVERSRLQINRYYIGASRKSPFWMGLDVDWLAPFGTDHRMRLSFAATSSDAYTFELGYLVPMIADLPLSLMFSVQSMSSFEDLYGPLGPGDARRVWGKLDRLGFGRHGGSAGIGYAPIPHVRLMLRLEYMRILRQSEAGVPGAQLDRYLKSGWSNLASLRIMAAYDSREGRDLPNAGHMVALALTGSARMSASQYGFFKLSLAHQSNFEFSPQHVLRIDSFAGAQFGDAPFFEKFFFNDFYALAPSRIHRLNPSSRGAYDIFGTGASSLSYEDFLVHLALSYAWQPFVRRLELFMTVGATYADTPSHGRRVLGIASRAERGDFPVDLSFNLGVRFKTDYGLVGFSLVNVFDLLGR